MVDEGEAMARSDDPARVSITHVTRSLGITARALRHYDSMGLVRAARDRGNRRAYSEGACRELEGVGRLRGAGVSLDDIGWVLQAGRKNGAVALREAAIGCLTQRLSRLTMERFT